ncbi:MAG: hypothetical protein E6G57_14325, partial [Actinobacteria bacterium]
FCAVTFPAAVWYSRRFVAVSAALFLIPAFAVGLWLANSPRAVEATGPKAVREAYVNQDFQQYYRSAPASEFASQVFTNNVQVSIYAFAAGIALCVPTAFILMFNGANVGVAGGLFEVLGPDPSARPARAHGCLHRRRRRTAAGVDAHRPR